MSLDISPLTMNKYDNFSLEDLKIENLQSISRSYKRRNENTLNIEHVTLVNKRIYWI